MKFQKGQSGNSAGRPIGSKNKISNDLRETITNFIISNFNQIERDFQSMTPKDRSRLFCELLSYSLPKLQNVQKESEFEFFSDNQLDSIIESFKINKNEKE